MGITDAGGSVLTARDRAVLMGTLVGLVARVYADACAQTATLAGRQLRRADSLAVWRATMLALSQQFGDGYRVREPAPARPSLPDGERGIDFWAAEALELLVDLHDELTDSLIDDARVLAADSLGRGLTEDEGRVVRGELRHMLALAAGGGNM